MIITLVLVILGFIYQCVKHFWGEGAFLDFLSQFNLNKEENIPAIYSALLLLFAAVLLMRISILKRRDRYCFHWLSLSVLFAYLSLDEAMAIHEDMKQLRGVLNLDTNHVLYNDAWISIGVAFVGIVGLLYFRFLRSLPKRIRILFLASAGIYILGALGMEIGGYWQFFHGKDFIHTVSTTIEELLEMLGVVLFIDTLLPIAAPKKLKTNYPQKQLPLDLPSKEMQKHRINRF